MDLAQHRDALLESCRRTEGVTSLVVFGSATSWSQRRDEWSDLVFNLFLTPSAAEGLYRDWPLLPDPEQLLLTAREGDNGGVALYADGVVYEFGAGRPWTIRDPEREVLLDGGDLAWGDPEPPPDPSDQIRLFLVKLYLGMGRVRRGERVSGGIHVRAHAVTCLGEALRQPAAGPVRRARPFDPLRRLEAALPEAARRIAALLDQPVEECAHGLFLLSRDLLEPGWAAYPSRAADLIAARLGWVVAGS